MYIYGLPLTIVLFFAATLGAVLGSFLNVVILRTRAGISLNGRSHCPHCKYQLRWFDLVPVFSYLTLLGKCRSCGKAIHWQYPLVEASTAILFIAVTLTFWSTPILLVMWLVASCFLVLAFVYDLRYMELPDHFTLPLVVIGLVGNVIAGTSWQSIVTGGVIGGGFFALQYLLSRGRWIGDGDIRLGFGMGTLLGFPIIISALAIAYTVGSAFALVAIFSGNRQWGDKIPFGTFLVIGTVFAAVYGQALIHWYLGLLGL